MTCPARPRGAYRLPLLVAGVLLASALALDWNLTALSSWRELAAGLERLGTYLAAFAQPDLSAPMLARAAHLALETLAVAFLGVALGLLVAYPLALASCSAVMTGGTPRRGLRGLLGRAGAEAGRVALDVLRGVPDFVWAILLANFTGTNAITGALAVGVNVAGILGKVLSEQWDNVDPQRYAAVRATGAGRLATFVYGVQPLASRAMLSFVLMRTECAVRNASVIGVVGGGGLGAGLWDEYTDRAFARVATILLCMLLVTATTDLLANFLRRHLRTSDGHGALPAHDRATTRRRRLTIAAVVTALLLLAGTVLRAPLARVSERLAQVDWSFVRAYTVDVLLRPELSLDALALAARESAVPLAVAALGTLVAALFAALLAYPSSIAMQSGAAQYTGERVRTPARLLRWANVVGGRAIGVVLRGVPEVAWVVLLSVFFQIGVTPCVLAVVLHSTGVLQRVFAETLDDIPYRRFEQLGAARRSLVFLYGGVPLAWPNWKTYAFFQFEVNVRIGVVLGTVGAGGLGDKFQTNLLFREHHRAGTLLWAMVLLTLLIDRTSRWLALRRKKC